jgi:putative DNA primase/helicase
MRVSAEDIARALGGRRSGAGWVCKCPSHDDHDPSLRINERDGKVLVKCWGGCEQNDVIGALRRKGLWSRSITLGSKPEGRPLTVGDAAGLDSTSRPRDPMKPWRNGSPFVRGSTVDTYLKGRGIDLTDSEAASLRFSARLFHHPTKTFWPAMLARVALAPLGDGTDGLDLTTHQTFLEPVGSGKAPVEKPRLFAAGGKTAGGGVWFSRANPDVEFAIGEGVETVLSVMRIYNVTAGCAALSAIGVARLILPPQARRVLIFIDNDERDQSLDGARQATRRWRAGDARSG